MEFDADNLSATELTLGPPGSAGQPKKPQCAGAKRPLEEQPASPASEDVAPPPKAQVVGWPPVRAYRKNTFSQAAKKAEQQQAGGLYVKVSMDGAPYLRKVDLKMYRGYRELREALDLLFNCFSAAGDGCGGQFAVAYEDKDGDLMLVGDVPWDMFVSSCKKLRIMRGSETCS